MNESHDRRLFLKYLGAGMTGVATSALGPLAEARGAMPFQRARPLETGPGSLLTFTPIQPSMVDDLVLPPELRYSTIAAWGDRLPRTSSWFGYHADYTAFLPIAGNGGEGLLFANHE